MVGEQNRHQATPAQSEARQSHRSDLAGIAGKTKQGPHGRPLSVTPSFTSVAAGAACVRRRSRRQGRARGSTGGPHALGRCCASDRSLRQRLQVWSPCSRCRAFASLREAAIGNAVAAITEPRTCLENALAGLRGCAPDRSLRQRLQVWSPCSRCRALARLRSATQLPQSPSPGPAWKMRWPVYGAAPRSQPSPAATGMVSV
ncbi:hypothetical protein C4K18_4015 [Pseudomonas chlororaphis subsp. aurantiaca]|nr:hypothetical protein C4K18_4015 [Pseudomonas chlororaphis subsp. aurantiaca]